MLHRCAQPLGPCPRQRSSFAPRLPRPRPPRLLPSRQLFYKAAARNSSPVVEEGRGEALSSSNGTPKNNASRQGSPSTSTSLQQQQSQGLPVPPPFQLPWNFFGDMSNYASSLVSGLLQWKDGDEDASVAQEVLQEASSMEKEMQGRAAPADISQFLTPVPLWELKHIRKLSHLCAISYKLHTVTRRALRRKHGLELVVASWACDAELAEAEESAATTPDEVAAEGDGMGVTLSHVREAYRSMPDSSRMPQPPASSQLIPNLPPPPPLLSNIVPVQHATGSSSSGGSGSSSNSSGKNGSDDDESEQSWSGLVGGAGAVRVPQAPQAGQQQQQRKWASPTDLVAAKLAEAAAAAAAAAGQASGPLAEAANSLYSGFTSSLPLGGMGWGSSSSSSSGESGGSGSSGKSGVSGKGVGGKSGGGGKSGAKESEGEARERRQQEQAQQRMMLRVAAEATKIAARGPPALPQAHDNHVQQQQQQQQQRRATGASAASSSSSNASSLKSPWSLPSPPGWPSPSLSQSSSPQASSSSSPSSSLAASLSSAAGGPGPLEALQGSAQATDEEPKAVCPSEWFVCDDAANHTRIFVIQGSDTIDHWKLNVTFDPVVFEDPGLGVKVHRGVYEAAKVLYRRFLPLVHEALDSSPCAKICFTGHSIGGSLGTLLALMYVHRGVLSLDRLATLYTFGAPAVFCECNEPGGCGGAPSASAKASSPAVSGKGSSMRDSAAPQPPLPSQSRDQARLAASNHMEPQGAPSPSLAMQSSSHDHEHHHNCAEHSCCCDASASHGVLAMLGLPTSLVRNVIMSRDIVPRAFACDYSLVADILKGWGPSFKEHGCLAGEGRKHLYYFIGHMMVLQPDHDFHWFVSSNEPDHPMLPPGPNMFLLGTPTDGAPSSSADSHQDLNQLSSAVADSAQQDRTHETSSSSSSSSSSSGAGVAMNGSGSSTGGSGGGVGGAASTIESGSHASSSSSSSSGKGVLTSGGGGGAVQGNGTASDSMRARVNGRGVHELGTEQPASSSSSGDSSGSSGSNGSSQGGGKSGFVGVRGSVASFQGGGEQGLGENGRHAAMGAQTEASSSSSRSKSGSSNGSSSSSTSSLGVSGGSGGVGSSKKGGRSRSSSPSESGKAAEQKRAREQLQQQPPVRTHTDAVNALMDNPHPLDILADPGAYLSSGSISRYHNPDNYTAALGRLIYLKRKEEGRIPTWVFRAYSQMLRMESELEARTQGAATSDANHNNNIQHHSSSNGRPHARPLAAPTSPKHPYVSAWDGTHMDVEDRALAAQKPLEVHHW